MSESVFITFDDGPDREWTPQVLDVLAAAGVRATFFVIGQQVPANAGLVRRIRAAGHEVGNHTWSHRHPLMMGPRRARSEVRDGARVLADTIGEAVKFFRPPHGRTRRCMTDEAAALGEELVLWDVSAIDWGVFGQRAGIARRLQAVSSGDVVLMHDGRNRSNTPGELIAVLPGFLSDLARRGLTPLPLSARRTSQNGMA